MTSPLLETKLYVPRLRRRPVARRRLSDRLRHGAESKLTLISAPAGFGKTTLLADWLARSPDSGRAVAWLSLDQGDDDSVSFWTYLIGALQTAAPGVGARALHTLQEPHPSPIETVVATLLNELSAAPKDIVLVLDDYHMVDTPDVQVGMSFLLEHLPPNIHVIIATRADPALPLSRMRARGEVVEIRAADLRFTLDEAAGYLNEVMNLDLSPLDVAALESRTEGWIAALQLAGLSMQGRDDVAGFIAGFAGDDRYIVDYLVDEVLRRQPEHVRRFLLRTSILARMCAQLCNAVTEENDGKAMLESLERGNLFLVPLDDRRHWYRYHHLFGDVLRAHLLDEAPDLVADLHHRATEWFERNGERLEAIRHAMAGDDMARAADLIELSIPATTQARQEAKLRHWLEALPDELIRMRPVLNDGYAGSLLVRGETEGVEARLRDSERWLDIAAEAGTGVDGRPAGMVVVDEEAFRDLPRSIAIHRAGLARLQGDVAGTIAHAQRALDLVRQDDQFGRGAAAALLGIAEWTRGDLEAALRLYGDAMGSFAKIGYLSDIVGCSIAVADMQIAQGRLGAALSTYERGLGIAGSPGTGVLRGGADMHVGMSEILRERNDLDGAVQQLRKAMDLGEDNGLPQNPYRSRVAAARIQQAQGDLDAALALLTEADRLYDSDFSPDVRPVDALKARVWIAQGNLPEAWSWARGRGLSMTSDLTYVHEFEHSTFARLILAQGTRDGAADAVGDLLGFTARLLAAADAGGRTGSVIDLLVVQALAHHAIGDTTSALASLARLSALAELEGYVRVVADEGPPMAALLKLAAKERNASTYTRRLLAAVVGTERLVPVDQSLVEPLSERELEILRLLQGDLDGPDMARELTVSLSTVRTHTRNIYAKLGVNSRRAAVRRAAELGLLSRTTDRRPTA